MNSHHLRAIILKLQDRRSDDDRKRLHFFLGNDVPRRIRDDPSLGGTLGLMESLFDQDKINEEDFTFLINAFDEIQCIDAVKLLREHMRRIRSNGLDQSVQSLSLLMPVLLNDVLDDQDDKFATETRLIDQTSIYGDNNTIISHKNINNNPVTILVDGAVIGASLWIFDLRMKCDNVVNEQTTTTTQPPSTILLANTSVTARYGSHYGGTVGATFDDPIDLNLTPMKPCIGVEVFWRTNLCAIRFIYEQNDSSLPKVYYGEDGNPRNAKNLSNETFLLTNEERISKVTLYVGIETGRTMWKVGNRTIRYILGIQFHTTTGRTTRLYGVNDGEKFIDSFDGFTLGYAKAKSGLLVDMLQFVWYNYGPFGKTHDGVWVEAANGKVPPDAVVGGQEDNRRVYVVRFKTKEGNMIPGKLVESNKTAEGPYGGVRTSSVYQVLTNPDPKRKFKWIPTSGFNIPDGAFVAGKEEDNTLYVARVSHDSGSILIGKYHAPYGTIYFTHEGHEKRLEKNFEVLCVS